MSRPGNKNDKHSIPVSKQYKLLQAILGYRQDSILKVTEDCTLYIE
ncbi:1071_t:CDS:2 [Dentiscutata erythropus]|uniref:1071_t:CDS:1 n=1 Tax=Dentiscutata erythropus TaxID=1348616 RepID=A0A9N9F478_9GLOM|nr:1071_t:CDS:2 [Dentiscutata erythropus]